MGLFVFIKMLFEEILDLFLAQSHPFNFGGLPVASSEYYYLRCSPLTLFFLNYHTVRYGIMPYAHKFVFGVTASLLLVCTCGHAPLPSVSPNFLFYKREGK